MTIMVGKITGICSGPCVYDMDRVCVNCHSLDPEAWTVVLVRSKTFDEVKLDKSIARFREAAERAGLDSSALTFRHLPI